MRKYLLPSCSLLCVLVFSYSGLFAQCNEDLGLDVSFSASPEFCSDAELLTGLSGGFPLGGVYSGPGVIDDGNGETYSFDPSVPGIGTHTLTYTVENMLQWMQTGQKIEGEAAFTENGEEPIPDGLGAAIDVTSDGNTIALGARFRSVDDFEGVVEVYDWNGNAWIRRGPDLVGESSFSRFGTSVSISADGNRVAISSPANSAQKFVRVYAWNGARWIPLGQDILSPSATIELSSDGARLMIGSTASSAGEIKVYDWEGGEWIQAGSTIEGLQANESIGSIATLSGDGNTIAAGVPGNTINTGTTGEVRTYVWDGSDWVAQGDFLEGNAIGERFGKSVSLSVNGTRLAVGSLSPETDGTKPGKVFVFQWDGMVWQPVGSPISGLTDGDDFGSSISINSNGKRLAVGSRENDLNGKGAGLIQVFDLIGGKWVQVGGNILGDNPEIEDETFDDDGLGGKIVLAANGTRVVGGSDGLGNLDGLILGYVTTYSLAPGSISCFAEDEVEIKTCEDCERVNYALGNPTSNSCDYGFAYSDLGVDGIIKGDNPWGTPDIVHTCVPPTTDPWWHVDLQREIFVTEVCLYNRNSQIEAILDRLSEYYIFVSPQPFDENASLEDLLADRTIYHTFVEERAAFPSCIEIPQVFGRYVRIQLPGTRILNFAELEVYGCKKSSCINPPNIALKKEARQSTTYGFGDASIAVDGDIDGTRGPWSDPSIQHTDREEQPWWQVDLGKPSTVKEVSIFNRTECCVQRLQDFYVFVSPRPIDGDLPVEELVANPDIAFEFVKGNAGPKETLTFSNEVGQYVMVKLSKIGILHMSEVEVIGCEGQTASSPSNRFAEAGEDLDAALTTGLTTLAYPNPFRENLTLEIGGELQAGAQLELINSLGQVVDRQAITGNTHQIEGRNLPQGMYFVQLQNGVDQHKIKVVKLQ